MSSSEQIEQLDNSFDLLRNQFDLLVQRVQNAKVIEPKNNSPEEERAQIIKTLQDHAKSIEPLYSSAKALIEETAPEKNNPADLLKLFMDIDSTISKIKEEIKAYAEEQYECRLEIFRQEIYKSFDSVRELFDFIIPNIHYEYSNMKKFYAIPSNAGISILPQLEELFDNFENGDITLKEFIFGYGTGEKRVEGYNELRCRNNFYSKYQFYEVIPETYKEINTCLFNMRKAIDGFLSERRNESDFETIYKSFKDSKKNITAMVDIFEVGSLFNYLVSKVGKKYSYTVEYQKTKTLITEFDDLQKRFVVYNQEEIDKTIAALKTRFSGSPDAAKFEVIITEAKKFLEEKKLPFKKIEEIFSKLINKNFNIVVSEKEREDITVIITPHHEKKYGREVLDRINTIIMEIEFWYPEETKVSLVQELAKTTHKIQEDQGIDRQEFFKLMQNYDKEIEKTIRSGYQEKINQVGSTFSMFQTTFNQKINKEKLQGRLVNTKIWQEMEPSFQKVKKNLAILTSGNSSVKSNANKFPFLQIASDEMCQVLYDLSMQLFIHYEGVDRRSITRMTDILSTYNEFHDISSLWMAFTQYFKKTALNNLLVNEKVTMTYSKLPACKNKMAQLFSQGANQ